MDNTSSDESVSQFLAITGSADAGQANSYLEMSGNDLQTAISLFLEHQAAGPSGGGALGGSDSMMGSAPNDIRAPDQTRRMQLVGFDDGPAAAMGMGAGMMEHPLLRPGSRMNAFAEDYEMDANQELTGSLRDIINRAAATGDDEIEDDLSPQTQNNNGFGNNGAAGSGRATRLSDMFATPLHLTHSAGGFQGARNVAKDSKRWLLVNLQSDSDFACHALNRDVWRDELCENLIREGFIFWQSENTTDDGRTYCERYNVSSFPHIGIIDPRTGRLMYKKEGWTQVNPLTPIQFAELAADFCSRHSLDKAPAPPKRSANNGPSPITVGTVPSNDTEMTEEQQLQAAIRASMNDTVQDVDDIDDDDDSVEYVMEDDDDVECMNDHGDIQVAEPSRNTEIVAEEKKKPPSFTDEIIAMDVGDEPSDNAAKVMIRMPDGKRLVRKFKTIDRVKIIYAFVAQANEDAKGGKEFVMKAGFPPKDLVDSVNESISNTGLAGDSITVRWKED